MKKYLDAVLVVEGKEDASYLSNYIASEIVVVNGFELSKKTINYLKNKKVILLLDPDEAGQRIREKINQELDNVINIEIDINKCTRNVKNGVAECEIGEILYRLTPYFVDNTSKRITISNAQLSELGILNNKDLREYISEQLKLGKCNNKQLIKRLSFNNIDIGTLKNIVDRYKDGN